MQIMDEPYFLINNDYWYYDTEECKFKLTEEGLKSKKARESYEQFYKDLEEGDENERD